MILHDAQLSGIADALAQRITRANQDRRGRHGAGQYACGQADVPAKKLAESQGQQQGADHHHNGEHEIIFAIPKENGKKVGACFNADAENKQHETQAQGIRIHREVLLT